MLNNEYFYFHVAFYFIKTKDYIAISSDNCTYSVNIARYDAYEQISYNQAEYPSIYTLHHLSEVHRNCTRKTELKEQSGGKICYLELAYAD